MRFDVRKILLLIAALLALLFGLLTLKSGGSVLFIDGPARRAAGHYVPFVLWFNFLAGFLYIATAVGMFRRQIQAYYAGLFLFASTALVFLAFLGHIYLGGLYETRTFYALIFRSSFWLIMSIVMFFTIRKDS